MIYFINIRPLIEKFKMAKDTVTIEDYDMFHDVLNRMNHLKSERTQMDPIRNDFLEIIKVLICLTCYIPYVPTLPDDINTDEDYMKQYSEMYANIELANKTKLPLMAGKMISIIFGDAPPVKFEIPDTLKSAIANDTLMTDARRDFLYKGIRLTNSQGIIILFICNRYILLFHFY